MSLMLVAPSAIAAAIDASTIPPVKQRRRAAVDNEVLGALDDTLREVLYNLLLQAARGSDVKCPLD